MRRISIREALGEPTLAAPLVDERGAYVLAAGKPLTSSLAVRLWERGFRHAYIEFPGFEDVVVLEPLRAQTYSKLRRLQAEVVAAVRQLRPGDTAELPVAELTETVAAACDELAALSPRYPFMLYPPWSGRQDEWISFSINAAVLAGLLGLQQNIQAARTLFLAALVQDVGVWRSDRPKDHVAATIDVLRPVRELSPVVKAVAAEHHELLDGSGHPHGKTREALHELSPCMAVVVAYLEMVGGKANPVLPHEALEGLLAGADVLYDRTAVETFRHIVPTYPPGTVVRLSNGRRGVVLEPGPPGLHRPSVRILPSSVGRVGVHQAGDLTEEETEEEYPVVDLSTELSVVIDRVLH